jgi:hypothetical protein
MCRVTVDSVVWSTRVKLDRNRSYVRHTECFKFSLTYVRIGYGGLKNVQYISIWQHPHTLPMVFLYSAVVILGCTMGPRA